MLQVCYCQTSAAYMKARSGACAVCCSQTYSRRLSDTGKPIYRSSFTRGFLSRKAACTSVYEMKKAIVR